MAEIRSVFSGTKKPIDPVVHTYKNSKYIIERELKDVVKKIGEGEEDFVIEKKLVEISRVDRIESVQSYKDDVGIENILRKFNETQDPSVLNVITRHPGKVDEEGYEEVIDITGLKDNVFDNALFVAQARRMINNLDPEYKDALLNMSDADLATFLKSKMNKQNEDKKEEE